MRRALISSLILLMQAAAQTRYRVDRETVDGVDVYVLRDNGRGAVVRVVPALGNNSYEMTVNGKPVFWSPYKTLAEFKAKPAHLGNPLLWPWANRIDGMSYWAAGRQYVLKEEIGNVRGGPNNTPIHGLLVYSGLWRVVRAHAGNDGAELTSRIEYWMRPELMAQFPFAHVIEMTYRLAGGRLEVETAIRNLSGEPMPVSLGYHPYFQVTDAPRDEWVVQLAARTRHVLSNRLIPTGDVEANPYASPLALKGAVLDDVFDGLVRDPDGIARFSVQGRRQKVTVEYGPKFTVAVVYAPAGRSFICFEPMTAITNAFNAAHAGWYKGLQMIAPGAEWREVYRVVPSGY